MTTLPVNTSVENVSIDNAVSPTSSSEGIHFTAMRMQETKADAMMLLVRLRHSSPTCTGPGSSSKDFGCESTKNRKFDKDGEFVKNERETALGTAMASYDTARAVVWANMGLVPSHTVETT